MVEEFCASLNRAVLEEHAENTARALFDKLNEPVRSKRAPLYSTNLDFFESVPGFDPESNRRKIG
jgi:hypothetical protein